MHMLKICHAAASAGLKDASYQNTEIFRKKMTLKCTLDHIFYDFSNGGPEHTEIYERLHTKGP